MGAQASLLGRSRAEGRARVAASSDTERVVRFGVIADVQWADADDGVNYSKTVVRHYRGALTQLGRAVRWWNEEQPVPLDFVANLGDVIDGMWAAHPGTQQRAGTSGRPYPYTRIPPPRRLAALRAAGRSRARLALAVFILVIFADDFGGRFNY
jgi:hypothetical protein